MTFVLSETSDLQQDLNIVNNEIRGFIISLFRFFSESKINDGPLVYEELNNMKGQLAILLEQIKVRQERLKIENENVQDTFLGYEDIDSGWTTLSDPFEFASSSGGGSDLQAFTEEIKKNSEVLDEVNNRMANLKGNIGIDISSTNSAEGFANVMGELGNLRRAKNYSNLAGLFDFS
jgi:hypothetical protein